MKRTLEAAIVVLICSTPAWAQTAARSKAQPKATPTQSAPDQPKRTEFSKEFAKLLMQAVEAVESRDGSEEADHRAEEAKAKALAEADMELDNTVRENEKMSVTFGLLVVDMVHRTYEISGNLQDLKKSRACSDDYKEAIRKAVVTEQVGDKLAAVVGGKGCQ